MAVNLHGTNGINSSGNIVTQGYFVGDGTYITNVAGGGGTQIVSGTSSVAVTSAGGPVLVTTGGTNTWQFDTAGNLTLPSNVASINYANGAPYGGSGGTGNYGNANVSAYLASGTNTANIITTGNVSSNNFIATGNLTAAGITTIGTDSNITGVDTYYGNAVTVTGNIQGDYFLGNGFYLTDITSSYGNANVSAYLASGTNSANIITTGNISATNITTTGASGNVSGVNYYLGNAVTVSGDVTADAVLTSTVGSATSPLILDPLNDGSALTGNLVILGNANVTGTLTYNNISSLTTDNLVLYLGNNQSGINVSGGGMIIGATSEAALTYNYANQTWNTNLGFTANGNINSTGLNVVSGLITINGNQAVNGPAFSAYNSANIVISSDSPTFLAQNVKEFDTATCFNNTSSTVTLNGISTPAYSFAPNVPGYYQVDAAVSFASMPSSTGIVIISLYKNGSEFKRGVRNVADFDGSGSTISTIVYMNGTTDTLATVVLQGSGGAAETESGFAYGNYFQAALIRGA